MQTDTAETAQNAAGMPTEQQEQAMKRLFADLAEPVPTVGFRFADADIAIDAIEDAGNDLAMATYRETQLYDGRALEKSAAIVRLMATNNAETNKLHSASSAEKVVESDAVYMAYRDEERAAVVTRIQAEAALSSAKLRARLAVVMAEASL